MLAPVNITRAQYTYAFICNLFAD